MSATIKHTAKAKAITEQRALEAMAEYARAKASVESIESQQAIDILEVKQQYAKDLQAYTQQRDEALEVVHAYAEQHPELFSDKKSRTFGMGQIGYRQGPEKLQLIEGWNWDKVAECIDDDFKRVKEEVKKDALLNAAKTDPEWAKEVGVAIVREEIFFVKI